MNQCIHNIDLLLWSVGSEVDTVFSMCGRFGHDIEAEDFGSILIRFKNGAVGTVEGSVCVYPKNLEETLSIFGEKGTVCIGGIAINRIETWRFADGAETEAEVCGRQKGDPESVYGYGHPVLFKNFIDAIRNSGKPLITGAEGKKPVEVILAAYKSRLTGLPVKLPLSDFSTMNMKEALI